MIETQVVMQYMVANGCVLEDDFQAFLQKISEESATQINREKVYQLVQQINKRIKPFNLMIRKTLDEITTNMHYVLISTVDNIITREATQYTEKQYEFFKFTLQAIVNETRGIIPELTIRDMAEKAGVPIVGKTSKVEPEYKILLDEWINKLWFHRVFEESEYITLGVRAIAELDVFIKQHLIENPDELDCQSCHNISIYSVLCPGCQVRYHKRCSKMSIDPETHLCKLCPGNSSTTERRPTKLRRTRS